MCTRVFNNQAEDFPTTARNMDWATQLPTRIFTFRRGLKKSGIQQTNDSTLIWKSLYDSVVTMVGNESVGYGSSDGMNSEGLVANVLYDSAANYGDKGSSGNLDVLRWVQYVLDVCRNVSEVVEKFTDTNIHLIGSKVPGSDKSASLHLSISDASGQTAIIEVINGEFKIYYEFEGSKNMFRIMTNQPDYKTQILLNQYWRYQWSPNNDFASRTIPGGPFPTDRFERASFYLNVLDAPGSMEESLAQVRSIVENASVPIGFNASKLNIVNHPNIAPTLWSTLSDHKSRVYYFCNARTTDVLWIDLKELNIQSEVSSLEVVKEKEDKSFENYPINGLANCKLTAAVDPYRVVKTNVSNSVLV